MSKHENDRLPTYAFHPELGFLCPSLELRKNVRVGIAAAAFGLVTGVAGAMALLPKHVPDPIRTSPLLAVAPSDASSDLESLSIGLTGAPPGAAALVSTDGHARQLAPMGSTTPVAAANEALRATETPVRPTPVVTAERGVAAVTSSEHSRAVANKRTRTAKATTRRHVREPYPAEVPATSPFNYETRRFSDDTRSGRRRDKDGSWPW
jgi:hypothetical protein